MSGEHRLFFSEGDLEDLEDIPLPEERGRSLEELFSSLRYKASPLQEAPLPHPSTVEKAPVDAVNDDIVVVIELPCDVSGSAFSELKDGVSQCVVQLAIVTGTPWFRIRRLDSTSFFYSVSLTSGSNGGFFSLLDRGTEQRKVELSSSTLSDGQTDLSIRFNTEEDADLFLAAVYALSYQYCGEKVEEGVWVFTPDVTKQPVPSLTHQETLHKRQRVWRTHKNGTVHAIQHQELTSNGSNSGNSVCERAHQITSRLHISASQSIGTFVFEEKSQDQGVVVLLKVVKDNERVMLSSSNRPPPALGEPSPHSSADSERLKRMEWQIGALYDLCVLRREPPVVEPKKRETPTEVPNTEPEPTALQQRLTEMENNYKNALRMLNDYETKNKNLEKELELLQQQSEKRISAATERTRTELGLQYNRDLLRLKKIEDEYNEQLRQKIVEQERSHLEILTTTASVPSPETEERVLQLERQLSEERMRNVTTRRKLEDEIASLTEALERARTATTTVTLNEVDHKKSLKRILNLLYSIVENKLAEQVDKEETRVLFLTLLHEAMLETVQ